jgi:hypothetical protein
VLNDDTGEGHAGQGLALIGASWLAVREGDMEAATLALELRDELAEAGELGVGGMTAAAVALLDAVHDLAGPEVARAALKQAGTPGLRPRPQPPE